MDDGWMDGVLVVFMSNKNGIQSKKVKPVFFFFVQSFNFHLIVGGCE